VIAAGVPPRRAVRLAVASDTVSIATMEVVDNAFILLVPGAIAAGLAEGLFWWSLLLSLVIAFLLTVPVNRWLIRRGRGHAVIHELHGH
jgi:membrane protein implicated in regulation of membrane protease activity